MNNKKILSIDLGESKSGLALAEAGLAFPLKLLKGKKNSLEAVVDICRKEQVDVIVIGIANSKQEKKAEGFGKKLAKRIGVKVFYQDENLTTKEALDKMIKAGKSRKYRKEKDDLFAACLILERFLEENV